MSKAPPTLALLITLSAIGGCSSESPPTAVPSKILTATAAPAGPQCENTSTAYLKRCWAHDRVIDVAVVNSAHSSDVEEALGRWNPLLLQGGLSTPRFSFSGVYDPDFDASYDVIVEVTGNGNSFCGQEAGRYVYVYAAGTGPCVGATYFYGSIASVVAHELVTVLGWADGVELHGVPGVSSNCTATPGTPSKVTGPLNSSVCYHDADGIIRLYRDGNVSLGSFENYWGKPILSESDFSVAHNTLLEGDSTALAASILSVGPNGLPASVAFPISSYQITGTATSNFAAPIARSGSKLYGLHPGSGNLLVRPGSPPAGYRLWAPLEANRQFPVTVQVDVAGGLRLELVTNEPRWGPFATSAHPASPIVVQGPALPVVYGVAVRGMQPNEHLVVQEYVDYSNTPQTIDTGFLAFHWGPTSDLGPSQWYIWPGYTVPYVNGNYSATITLAIHQVYPVNRSGQGLVKTFQITSP